jgi:glucokinase
MVARAVSAPLAIGVDVGGTKILAGLVDEAGNVLAEQRRPTPQTTQDDVLAALDQAVAELLDERVVAIGYGVPANLERGTRRLLRAVNTRLAGIDLVEHASERFGLPVAVENDGGVAALAEWRCGAGRSVRNLVMFTLGTGIGGGIVLEGELFPEWAELGHVVVQEGGPRCPCGGEGHLEAVASGQVADAVARELLGADARAEALVRAARAGDERALEALGRMGRSLGTAIASVVSIFAPELVVVGGGFGSAAGELVLGPARDVARAQAVPPGGESLPVAAASLHEDAGLVGAGLLAFSALGRA